MRWAALIVLLSCAGCSLARMDQEQGPGIVEKSADKTDELTKSTNAIQNQVTGFNLSLNQLATKMSAVEGDLLKIQNSLSIQTTATVELQTTVKSTITATAELQASIRSTINAVTDVRNDLNAYVQTTLKINSELTAKLESRIEAQIKAVADLEATIKGLASAQVGFGNRLENRVEELSQKVNAGRDSVISTVNFSQDVMKTIIYGNLFYMIVIVVIVLSIAAVMVVLINHSRGRAEKRYEDEKSERRLLTKSNVL